MKAATLDYIAPASVGAAIEALRSAGGDAKVIAGGQSLTPMLVMRLARPSLLVDLNRVDGLDGVRRENGQVVIGAMTRQRALETDPAVRDAVPVLAEVVRHIGHATIRNRGTVGGSVAHADPAAELPLALTVLEARFKVEGPTGVRLLSPEALFESAFTTSLEPDEVLTEIRVPAPEAGSRTAFLEVARRHGDFAIVAALAMVRLDERGRFADVRIGVAGASPAPLLAGRSERLLVGEAPAPPLIAAAAQAAAADVAPTADIHGSAAYRRELVQVLVSRALTAVSRQS